MSLNISEKDEREMAAFILRDEIDEIELYTHRAISIIKLFNLDIEKDGEPYQIYFKFEHYALLTDIALGCLEDIRGIVNIFNRLKERGQTNG